MGLEIERKFLIDRIPFDLSPYRSFDILQGYVSIEPEIRVRKKGEKYYYTQKSGEGLVRTEDEREITKNEFETLFEKTEGRFLQKTRYEIPYQSKIIELDVYRGKHEGLVVCEVEFESEEEANRFPVPPYFSKEVTNDKTFRNKVLACQKK